MAKALPRATERYIPRPLSQAQLAAIDLLAQGRTDTDTADALGVHRVTVTRWRCYSPEFQAQLNTRRRELWAMSADKLRALVPKAIDALAWELEHSEEPARAAVAILRLIGLDKVGEPQGPTKPEAIVDAMASERIPDTTDRMLAQLEGRVPERLRLEAVADLDAQLNAPIEGEALLLTDGQ